MVTPDPGREIYPNAPLKLVAFEYRFDAVQLEPSAIGAFQELLSDRFPVVGAPPQQLVITPQGASASVQGTRCFDVERRRSVLLTAESLGVETSRYVRFEEFRELVMTAISALEQIVGTVSGVRVGLRYIDEIDEAVLPAPVRWSEYIEPALSRALEHFELAPAEYQAAALFEPEETRKVLLRYGVMRQPAVDPAGALVIDSPPRGRYFLIDIDSSWERKDSANRSTDKGWLLDTLGVLHAPIRDLFERSVTEKLRDDMLRKGT